MTTLWRSSESSAAAGLCWRLGSLVSVQFNWLRELVVQLHLGLLKSNKVTESVCSSTAQSPWSCVSKTAQQLSCWHHLTCLRALRAIVWKACSTLIASLALVSKYGMLFLLWHQACARLVVTWNTKKMVRLKTSGKTSYSCFIKPFVWQINNTCHTFSIKDDASLTWCNTSGTVTFEHTCLFSKSILLPSTTKGKFSGSRGLAWIKNSSLQLSRVLKVLGAVTSNTRTQQSAPR